MRRVADARPIRGRCAGFIATVVVCVEALPENYNKQSINQDSKVEKRTTLRDPTIYNVFFPYATLVVN